jgi:PRC-barrel domain protein
MQVEMWTYREADAVEDVDLIGFEVEATDGHVGKIVDAAYELGSSWLVVDTGPWIFGKKVLLPAGTVDSVDPEARKVYVHRSREEIKNAPEHDPSGYADQEYRLAIADYYSRFF